MKNLNKKTIVLLVAAAVLLLSSAVGSTRAALTYYSENYSAEVTVANIGVTLLENGEAVSYKNYLNDGKWDVKDSDLFADLLDKDFTVGKSYDEVLEVKELDIKNVIKTNKSFSKKSNKLITSDEYKKMKFGTEIHECLEFLDLKNPDYSLISNKEYFYIIKKLLDNELLKNIDKAKIYQEYEFIYEEDNIKYHGVIDLMLEYDEYIDIIDYKLKNTNDENYNKQLVGYYNYIKTKTNKKINLYLYSLLEGKFYEVDVK